MHAFLFADFFDKIGTFFSRLFHSLGSTAGRFDPEHWMIAVAVLLVVGWLCLRGFGSRKSF